MFLCGIDLRCYFLPFVPCYALLLTSPPVPFTDFETRLRCLAELKRPSVLSGCKVNTKAAHCHFWRYSDLRTKGGGVRARGGDRGALRSEPCRPWPAKGTGVTVGVTKCYCQCNRYELVNSVNNWSTLGPPDWLLLTVPRGA